MNKNLLQVKNVSKAFTNHLALDDVSLDVPEGKVYGLLGPNGAGKTTLLRIINHITAPDKGEVLFDGHPLTGADVDNIGYLPEERGLYKKMKVGEQAIFFARLKGLSRVDATRQLKQWFEHFEILDWWNRKVEELSKGMAQKVQFIVTVLHHPKLLIFDEPFSGFDPINANLLKAEMLKLRDEGTTIIFSTHNMSSVETLCDHITLINKSRNILSGNVADLRRDFGQGRYTLAFNGQSAELMESLRNMAIVEEIAPGTDPSTGISLPTTTLSLKLNEGVTPREVIGLANDKVEIASFNPLVPSMDNIFIETVERNNRQRRNEE